MYKNHHNWHNKIKKSSIKLHEKTIAFMLTLCNNYVIWSKGVQMSAILKRLEQSFQLHIETQLSKEAIALSVKNVLSNESRTQLILHHAKINFEYNVLCSKIALEFQSTTATHALHEQMKEALKLAELLEIIYRDYLDVPREIARLRKEQRLIQQWLGLAPDPSEIKEQERYASETIRIGTGNLNLYRLFSVRLRRFIVAISAVTSNTSSYQDVINGIDSYVGPFLSRAACVYFIPRIANNLAMMIKHTIKHPWMSDEEKRLGWQTRFRIQFNSRWQDLSNDLPWMAANVVGLAVLTGELLPWGIVLSIGIQLYEVAQTCALYLVDQHNLKLQRAEYEKLLLNTVAGSEEYKKITDYMKHLDDRIDYEEKRLWLPIRNAIILFLAISFAAPIFSPWFMVLGGVIAVWITIKGYRDRIALEATKPGGNLFDLLKPPPEPASEPTPVPTQTSTPSKTGFFFKSKEVSGPQEDCPAMSPNNSTCG